MTRRITGRKEAENRDLRLVKQRVGDDAIRDQPTPESWQAMSHEEKLNLLRRLVELGWTRYQIGDSIGRTPKYIGRVLREYDINYRPIAKQMKEHNIEQRKLDLSQKRAELAGLALEKAQRFLEATEGKFLVFNFGGKDNTYAEMELDAPPTADIRNLMTSFGIAVQRSMELSKFDSSGSEDSSSVDEWLEAMGA